MFDARKVRPDTVAQTALWCGGVPVEEIDALDSEKRFPGINVQCGDDVKRASDGDFIIRYPDGQFDVLKPHEYRQIQKQ